MTMRTKKKKEVKSVLRSMIGSPVSLHVNGDKNLEGAIKYGTNLVQTNLFNEEIPNGKLGSKDKKAGYYFIEKSSSPLTKTILNIPLANVTSFGENYGEIEATLMDYTKGKPIEVNGTIKLI